MKVLIDNGHGKETAGKKSPFSMHRVNPALPFEEWSFNREIAKMLEMRLRRAGVDAERIVTEDIDVSLGERCRRVNAICNKIGARNVILISIHANACGNGDAWNTARGWCAYTSIGKTKSDALAECIYKHAAETFAGMKIRTDKTDGDSDIEENFYILKNSACPAVLTENFFYTNVDDVKFITSEKGKDMVTDVHFNAVVDYLINQCK